MVNTRSKKPYKSDTSLFNPNERIAMFGPKTKTLLCYTEKETNAIKIVATMTEINEENLVALLKEMTEVKIMTNDERLLIVLHRDVK